MEALLAAAVQTADWVKINLIVLDIVVAILVVIVLLPRIQR